MLAFLAHFSQKCGSSISMSALSEVAKEAREKVEPFSPESMVMTCVRRVRIWSMSSSQNLSPALSSSITAP